MDVHSLRPDGVGSAAAVIARAFNDDPLTVYLYPSTIERSRFAPLMFEALVRYDCLFGHVDYLDGFSAVATWMPPDETPETPERLSAAGFGELPDEIPLDRLDAFFAAIAPLHEHAVSNPTGISGSWALTPPNKAAAVVGYSFSTGCAAPTPSERRATSKPSTKPTYPSTHITASNWSPTTSNPTAGSEPWRSCTLPDARQATSRQS